MEDLGLYIQANMHIWEWEEASGHNNNSNQSLPCAHAYEDSSKNPAASRIAK